MSSSDFTFISLRNITAYQPTGSWVPQNYVLNMSTNGAAAWTNSIILETIQASSIIGYAVVATNIVADEIVSIAITGSTITGDTIIGTNITGSTITGSTIMGGVITGNEITASTLTGSTINGTNIGCENIVCSTMVGDGMIGSTIAVLSTFAVAESFFTTTTDYTYTGAAVPSSMLIVIGDNLWKIPVEFVSAL